MTVELPGSLEDFVRQKIAGGEFLSADEVVCAGLKLLQQHESRRTEIRQEINRGWEQAAGGQLLGSQEARESLATLKATWSESRPK